MYREGVLKHSRLGRKELEASCVTQDAARDGVASLQAELRRRVALHAL